MKIIDKIKEKSWVRNTLLFLAVLGPGIVTGSVDNDAGGITTYSLAGAIYGYKLLWTLVPSFIVLVVVQEMNARMGMVTGKGLADLIRENFGVKITFFIFIGLVIADIGNTATEFAGVAGSLQIFNVSKYTSVPLTAVAIWIFVVKGDYRLAERIFLFLSFCLLSYIISAVMAKPDWNKAMQSCVQPTMQSDQAYLEMVLGIIGTTIAPWMQFYMQSAVIEKGIKIKEYKFALADVIVGCTATVVVAFFIIVACAATLHPNGIEINDAKDAALALQPLAGDLAGHVFAFALFVASVFAATILPLATAFYVCEAFGFEAGINKKFNQAPYFYGIFTFIMVVAMIIILIPGAPLIAITFWSQVLNAILLPVVLISMIILTNQKKIMGQHVNNIFQNTVGLITSVVLVALSVMMIFPPIISAIINWFK